MYFESWSRRPEEARPRALKPLKHIEGNERGAQVWSVAGANTTLRVLIEAHLKADITIATSMIPVGTRGVGDPVVVTVAGTSPNYTIVSVRGGTYHPLDAPRGDPALSVARGIFTPAVIRGDEGEFDWTKR